MKAGKVKVFLFLGVLYKGMRGGFLLTVYKPFLREIDLNRFLNLYCFSVHQLFPFYKGYSFTKFSSVFSQQSQLLKVDFQNPNLHIASSIAVALSASFFSSLSSLMANHLRETTSLILATVGVSLTTYEIVNGSPFTVKHLLRFLISVLKYLPVAFSGWLTRSKHRLIYLYCGGFWLFIVWLLNQFDGRLNVYSHLVLQLVLVILLSCIEWWSCSDSLVESYFCSNCVQYIFNEDNQLSVSGSYELDRYCSHLTSDSQKLVKRRRILVAEVDGETVSGYETPIIESDEPSVPNRELSNDTAQTEDLLSSSDSHVESNIYSQNAQYIFNDDHQPSVSRSYELKRDCSHLTSDSQRLQKRRRISVAEVGGEPVSGYETPIIGSDKRFQQDCLIQIVKKFHAFHDFASFSKVCKDWRRACSNLKWSLYPPHPWLIQFQGQNIMNHLDDGKYVLERWKIDRINYYGCVNGWILNIGPTNIHIFNLFSMTKTSLPMLNRVGFLDITETSEWYNYIEKFILFKACRGDNLQFSVVALFGSGDFIAFKRPRSQHWIYIESRDIARCIDVVLFRGQFYALCDRGNLFLCGFYRPNPSLSLEATQLAGSSSDGRYYLVKNVDHLIAVFQKGEVGSGGKRFDTETFKIYRHDITTNWTRISKPEYLKGRVVFISGGNSWTIDAVEVKSCRTNYIYFVDDYWFSNNRDGHFIGVFDIANETIEDFKFEIDEYPPNDVSPFSLTDNDGGA